VMPARKTRRPATENERTMANRNYWLIKTEPSVYSIADLKRDKTTFWDGVRNYTARNFMRDGMKPGDGVFIHHSGIDTPGIAGIAKVTKAAAPDPTQFDPKHDHYDPKAKQESPPWVGVEVGFVAVLPKLVTMDEMRAQKALAKMALLQRGQRLSVQPVTEAEWNAVCALAGVKPDVA
jgi:predicted RNA-binding protein with PUA-like domain